MGSEIFKIRHEVLNTMTGTNLGARLLHGQRDLGSQRSGDPDGLYCWTGSPPFCGVGLFWSGTWPAPSLGFWQLASFSPRPFTSSLGRVCLVHFRKLDPALRWSVLLGQVRYLIASRVQNHPLNTRPAYSSTLLLSAPESGTWEGVPHRTRAKTVVAVGSVATPSFFRPPPSLMSRVPPPLTCPHWAPVLRSAWLTISWSLTFWNRHPWPHHSGKLLPRTLSHILGHILSHVPSPQDTCTCSSSIAKN